MNVLAGRGIVGKLNCDYTSKGVTPKYILSKFLMHFHD